MQQGVKAGANKVILPYQSAGQILAHSALKPNVVQFIESVTAGDMANRAGCCRRHEEIGGNRELSRDHSVLNIINEL